MRAAAQDLVTRWPGDDNQQDQTAIETQSPGACEQAAPKPGCRRLPGDRTYYRRHLASTAADRAQGRRPAPYARSRARNIVQLARPVVTRGALHRPLCRNRRALLGGAFPRGRKRSDGRGVPRGRSNIARERGTARRRGRARGRVQCHRVSAPPAGAFRYSFSRPTL